MIVGIHCYAFSNASKSLLKNTLEIEYKQAMDILGMIPIISFSTFQI